jgi:hypothetical protein
VYDLYHRFVSIVAPHQETLNDALRVGGDGEEVEADEVAFRCRVTEDENGDVFNTWLRFFGMCKRGCSKFYLTVLPDRTVGGAGQGGGGPLSINELIIAIKADTEDPVLVPRSIIHTDSAKAYKQLGPLRYPEAGAFQAPFEEALVFARFQYVHTNVVHKKKVGCVQEFVGRRTIRLASGEVRDVLGGTQKIDGYWASLKRAVGRKSANTGEDGTAARQWLLSLVRVHQWHVWNLDECRFTLFGDILDKQRNP